MLCTRLLRDLQTKRSKKKQQDFQSAVTLHRAPQHSKRGASNMRRRGTRDMRGLTHICTHHTNIDSQKHNRIAIIAVYQYLVWCVWIYFAHTVIRFSLSPLYLSGVVCLAYRRQTSRDRRLSCWTYDENMGCQANTHFDPKIEATSATPHTHINRP